MARRMAADADCVLVFGAGLNILTMSFGESLPDVPLVQVDTVRASREAEEVRLAELSARRDVISAEINALSDNMDELDVMRRDLNVEVTRTRPVAEIAEVDSDADGSLRELGIRTMGELSEADPAELERVGIEPERARVLIDAARFRTGPQR